MSTIRYNTLAEWKPGTVHCAWKSQRGPCTNPPSDSKRFCKRHQCNGCENGRPSNVTTCESCIVAQGQQYVFIAPSDAGSPSSASPPPSAASPPPNPFGDAPTVLPCTDPDLKKLLTPNPFGDAPTVPPCTDPDLKKLLTTFGLLQSVWPKLAAEEITEMEGLKDQSKDELINDIGLTATEADQVIAAISPQAKVGSILCAWDGPNGKCRNAPQGGRLQCLRHLCRTCDKGKPSGKKDKCDACDVAGHDTYVFVEPPPADVNASAASNPFGAPPAAQAPAKVKAAAVTKPVLKANAKSRPTVAKKAAPAPLADGDGGDNPFGAPQGTAAVGEDNPFLYVSVTPQGGASTPATPKSPPIQDAKLDIPAGAGAGAGAGAAAEDDNAVYGTATTFRGSGRGIGRQGSVIHAEDATLYAQIDPEVTVAQADDLYAEGAIDTNDQGLYAQVEIEAPEPIEEDNVVYGTATSFGGGKGMTRSGSVIHAADPNMYATVLPDDEVATADASDFYNEGAVNMNDDGNYANLDELENDGDEFE